MITQEFLHCEWISIEEEEDEEDAIEGEEEDAYDKENLPNDNKKLAKKRKLVKSSKSRVDVGDHHSKDKVERKKSTKREKSNEEKEEDKDKNIYEENKIEQFDELGAEEVVKYLKEVKDFHMGEKLVYPEIEELSEKLLPTDEDGKRIEPIDVGISSIAKNMKENFNNCYKNLMNILKIRGLQNILK